MVNIERHHVYIKGKAYTFAKTTLTVRVVVSHVYAIIVNFCRAPRPFRILIQVTTCRSWTSFSIFRERKNAFFTGYRSLGRNAYLATSTA